jgi:hypothetical protein
MQSWQHLHWSGLGVEFCGAAGGNDGTNWPSVCKRMGAFGLFLGESPLWNRRVAIR